jgi:hypothetical protein
MIDLSELDQEVQIPDPIAPARPVPSLGQVGSVPAPQGDLIPFTNANGVSGVLDSQGNMWNAGGQYIGQLTGTPAPTTPAPGPAASSTVSAGAPANQSLTSYAADMLAAPLNSIKQSPLAKWFGLPSLEDVVFIVLGLLLVAAAIFGFKTTQDAIQNVTRTATKAAAAAA